jgi:hypothetical protein
MDRPVSSITQAEVEARVAQVKIQAQAVWTGRVALARLAIAGDQYE